MRALPALGFLVISTAIVAAAARAEEPAPVDQPADERAAPRPVAEAPFVHGHRSRPDGAVVAAVEDETLARWNVGGSSDPRCVSNRSGYHVAPRVKVDTDVQGHSLPARSAQKGTLSEASILAQTRNHGYWPLRLCFQEGLLRSPSLAGKTHLRLSIDRRGHVSSARVLGTELRDDEVATCMATRLHALTYAPAPTRRTDVDVTVDLNPGDAPLPDTCTTVSPEGSEDRATSTDALPATVAESLAAHLEELGACYEAGLAQDPRLWGRIAFELDVAPGGRIRRVKQHDSRFPDDEVFRCGSRVLLTARLPAAAAALSPLVWGVRFGGPPAAPAPGNQPSSPVSKTLVADPVSTRVGVGP